MHNDPYVVSKATCGDCRYYRSLGGEGCGTNMFCSYTWETGKFKPLDMRCDECTFKETGRVRRMRMKGI